MLLNNNLKRCSNIDYTPRVLHKSQISWKTKKEEKKINKTTPIPISNNNKTTNSSYIEHSSLENPKSPPNVDSESKKREVIHEHLIFGLLLPKHPFSIRVKHQLSIISPMFPSVSVVIGNAYEFKELAARYYISSFPKVLYFRRGIYINYYDGEQTLIGLTSKIANWTSSLPASLPLKTKITIKLPSLGKITISDLLWLNSFSFHNPLVTHTSNSSKLKSITLPFNMTSFNELYIPIPSSNMEPFLGSVEQFENWDRVFFIASVIYCCFRFYMWITDSKLIVKWY
eukprot:gene7762-10547_t